MDHLLLEQYERLKTIHERLEDMSKFEPRQLTTEVALLMDDVRLWRDEAKQEYDSF